jgi:LEA14-like dessication related protein
MFSTSSRSSGLSLGLATLALVACSKPEPPTVRPLSVRTTAITPERLTLGVELDVYNPNSFALAVRNVNGVLELLDGAALGTAHAEPQTPLPAQASSVVNLQLDVPWQNMAVLTPFALSGADVPYRFRGTAKMGGERLNTDASFALEGKLTRAQVIELGMRGLGGP